MECRTANQLEAISKIDLFGHLATSNDLNAPNPASSLDEAHLQNLNDTALLEVFANLEFNDLLSAAELNPHFQLLVEEHFIIPRYHLDTQPISIFIGWNIFLTDHILDSPLANDSVNTIRILRLFGSVFNHLSVHFVSYTHPDLKQCFEHITKYCENASQEIVLYNVNDNVLSQWKNAFTKANSVIIKGYNMYYPIQLNEIFPRMKRFEIGLDHQVALEFLDEYFPRLEYFELNLLHEQTDDKYVRNFIRWNQRLEGLHLKRIGNFEFLQYVNQMLPQLEDLGLENRMINLVDVNNVGIQFENVRKFKLLLCHDDEVDEHQHQQVPSIEFGPSLESFELISTPTASINELIEYIARNKALNRVIIENMELSGEQLIHLIQELPQLKDLTVEINHHTVNSEMAQLASSINNSEVANVTISVDKQGIDTDFVVRIFGRNWVKSNEQLGFRRFLTFSRISL